MSQRAAIGPLGELHLDHEDRLDPVRRLVRGRHRREGRVRDREWTQQLRQPCEFGVREAAADVAGVGQAGDLGFVGVVTTDAHDERAEMLARLPRRGPPPDDELLTPQQLDLLPRWTPLAVVVDRRRLFRDQALPPVSLSARVEFAPVADRAL